MRKYTFFDMIRVQKVADDNPEMSRIEVVKLHDKLYPELTAKQKYDNLMAALNQIGKKSNKKQS